MDWYVSKDCQACRSHSSGAHAACLVPSLMRRSVSLFLEKQLIMPQNASFDEHELFVFILIILQAYVRGLVSVPLCRSCLRLWTTLGLWMQSSQRPICGGAELWSINGATLKQFQIIPGYLFPVVLTHHIDNNINLLLSAPDKPARWGAATQKGLEHRLE